VGEYAEQLGQHEVEFGIAAESGSHPVTLSLQFPLIHHMCCIWGPGGVAKFIPSAFFSGRELKARITALLLTYATRSALSHCGDTFMLGPVVCCCRTPCSTSTLTICDCEVSAGPDLLRDSTILVQRIRSTHPATVGGHFRASAKPPVWVSCRNRLPSALTHTGLLTAETQRFRTGRGECRRSRPLRLDYTLETQAPSTT